MLLPEVGSSKDREGKKKVKIICNESGMWKRVIFSEVYNVSCRTVFVN